MIWVEGLLNDPALLKWIIDISLKATLLLLIAGGITYLLRQASAATRHWVWSFGLFGVLLVPLLSMMLPSWNLPILPEIAPVEQKASEQLVVSESTLTPAQPTVTAQRPPAFFIFRQPVFSSPVVRETASQPAVTRAPETTNVIVRSEAPKPAAPVAPSSTLAQETAKAGVLPSTTVTEEAVQPTATSEPFSTTQWILVGVAVWSLGFIFILGRLLMGMLWIRWMSRKAQPVTDVYWATLCSDICTRFQILRPVRLWKGKNATTPMTWGVFRPVVLLPEESKDWSEEKCRVVLMHELAHVKRKDTLTQMIAQVACALFWFNPLVWVAAYKLRVEREHACDDQVLQLGTLASDYAGHLLDIARSLRSAKVASLATIAMARRSQLEGRLLAILDPKLNRRALSPMVIGFIAIVMVVVMLPLAAIQPWAPVPGDEVALASIEDHNESPDEFEPMQERPKLIEQNESFAEAPQPSLDLKPAAPETMQNSDDANVFVDVAQQIDQLKHFNEGSGGGTINALTLDQQIDTLIEKVGALLQTTTMHLTLLSQLFNEGEENAEEQVRARIQDYSVIYNQIMAELNQVLDDIEANHPDVPAESQLKQRFKAELKEETKALTDAALHLVDAIDVYVEIKLTDELGLVGEALSGVIEIVSKQIKIEIQMELSQLLENLVMLDSEAGTRIIIINPSTADINITIDADDLAHEWRHLIAGAKEFFKEFGKEMKSWSKDWHWDWDEDFEENMGALGEELGEELGQKLSVELGEEFSKDMEAWGEAFGEDMEAWGEAFEKDMEAWGEDFEEDMQEWAEEFEAEMQALEEHHHDHNHHHEGDNDSDNDNDNDNDGDSDNDNDNDNDSHNV